MSKEAKVGIFVLVGLVVLTYFTFKVSKWGGVVEKGYIVTADFENASGLEPKAAVKMAGVPIGRVEEIQLVANRAHLLLRIRNEIKIPIDSSASIQTTGLLGEKYVEILPGKAARNLADKERIAQTVAPANLDEIVKKVSLIADDVKKLTASLADSIGTPEAKQQIADIIKNVQETSFSLRRIVTSNEGRLDNIIANVNVLSRDIKDIASANKEDVRATIANLRAFSQTLKDEAPELAKKLEKMGEGVSQLVSDNRENIKEGIASFKTAAAKLDNTLDSANKVMGRIERGEGTIGKLINDNTTVTSINSTLEGINRYVRKADTLKTYLDYHFEYLTDSSDFKHYAHLTLQPTADKYYQLGIVDDP
ncbi:MAG TPA: MlaD family protein, partial [Candidatus Deferrimicrobiaceae bacterium]